MKGFADGVGTAHSDFPSFHWSGLELAARELRYFIFSSMDESILPARPMDETLLVSPVFCGYNGNFLIDLCLRAIS